MPKKTHPTDIAIGDSVTVRTPLSTATGVVRGLEVSGPVLVDPDDPERSITVEWGSISSVKIDARVKGHRSTARDVVPNSTLPFHLQRDPR